MRATVALIVTLIVSGAAFAEDKPCERGAQQQMVGGMDLDVIRCQVAVDAQRFGELQVQANGLTASLMLSRVDVARAEERAAKLRAELEWWKAAAKPLFPVAPKDGS